MFLYVLRAILCLIVFYHRQWRFLHKKSPIKNVCKNKQKFPYRKINAREKASVL